MASHDLPSNSLTIHPLSNSPAMSFKFLEDVLRNCKHLVAFVFTTKTFGIDFKNLTISVVPSLAPAKFVVTLKDGQKYRYHNYEILVGHLKELKDEKPQSLQFLV